MWNRRMEFELFQPTTLAFQQQHAFFKGRVPQVPAYAAVSKEKAEKSLAWLDEVLADRQLHCGRALHRRRYCGSVRGGFWPGSKNCDPAGSKKPGSLARRSLRPSERQSVNARNIPSSDGCCPLCRLAPRTVRRPPSPGPSTGSGQASRGEGKTSGPLPAGAGVGFSLPRPLSGAGSQPAVRI